MLKPPFFSGFVSFSLYFSLIAAWPCASSKDSSSSLHAGCASFSSQYSALLVTSPFISSGCDIFSLYLSFWSFAAATGDFLPKLGESIFNACVNFDSDSDSDPDSDVLADREREGEFFSCFSSFRFFFFFFFPE